MAFVPSMKSLYNETVEVVLPHKRLPRVVRVKGSHVVVGDMDQKHYKLRPGNCHIIGFGKAVSGMAKTLEDILGPKFLSRGVISVPKGSQECFRQAGKHDLVIPDDSIIEVIEGAENNIPDQEAFEAAKKIVDVVGCAEPGDILFVLISGGGSALLPYPTSPITLEDKSQLIKDLSRAGATIQELNSVRKRLSDVKGGKLALLAKHTQVVALILSDIIGDPLDLISSSPTVRNNDHPSLALQIVAQYGTKIRAPKSIMDVLGREEPGQDPRAFDHVQNVLIGNIDMALEGLANACNVRGFNVFLGSNKVAGEAKEVGRLFARIAYMACYETPELTLKEFMSKFNMDESVIGEFTNYLRHLREKRQPFCLVTGGETTVRVNGSGRGGRNQEMTLAFAQELNALRGRLGGGRRNSFNIHFMSAGTDGIDGPTDAAGAIAYDNLIEDALIQGLDVDGSLNNNDSFNFFSRLNQGRELLTVGHTGTNVMDIQLLSINTESK